MTQDEAHQFVFTKLGFCGCGNPEAALKLVKLTLVATEYKHSEHNREARRWPPTINLPQNWLERLLPSDGLYFFVLYQLDNAGLTEHGGSVGGAWLTPEGKEFLQALRTFGVANIINNGEES